jgi:2-methylcitrate dehydratase PrpD
MQIVGMGKRVAILGNRSPETIASALSAHISETPSRSLPAAALEAGKLYLLDTLAVAWAGSDAPGCREVIGLVASDGGAPEATVWCHDDLKLPSAAAAFANATMAAALDYDALGRDVPVHVNIAVVPAALALAERTGATGEELLAAIVLASDVEYRIALASTLPHRGWSYTAIHGGFGAAAAAARLLRLDRARTAHALGLAFLQASGTQQANVEPTLAKRLLSSFAARNGIQAALLANAGITAPTAVFEGDFGLFQLYQPANADKLLGGLGANYLNVDQSVKKYPSCGCNHTAIEAVLSLVRRHGIEAPEVQRVVVRISPYIHRIVGMDYDPSQDPQVAAQFSIRYSVACAMVRRRLGLAEIQADAARDPAILAHLDKIQIVVEPSWVGDRGPVEVTLQTRRGSFSERVDYVPGSREAPLSPEESEAKFRECFGLGVRPLSSKAVDILQSRIRDLERIASARDLLAGLR